MYEKTGLSHQGIIVDANHANSDKKFDQQPRICKEVLHSRNYDARLKQMIKGLMIESFIEEGAQKETDRVYGKSITDPCLGWEATQQLIYKIAENL